MKTPANQLTKYFFSFSFRIIRHSFLLFLFPSLGSGQGLASSNIDSLLTLLKKSKPDTNKVIHLNILSREYINIGLYDSSKYFGNEALQLATSIVNAEEGNWKHLAIMESAQKSMANSFSNFGIIYYFQGDYSNALAYYFKAFQIDEALKNKNGMAKRLSNIGIIYCDEGNYPKALDYYFKALKITEEKDKNGLARLLSSIGLVFYKLKDYPKTLDYYFRALKIAEEIGYKQCQSNTLGNIALVYEDQKEYSKAIDFFFNALKIAEAMGNKDNIATLLSNIGAIYHNKGDYQMALDNYNKALEMDEKLGNKKSTAIVLCNVSSLYTKLKKYTKSYNYLYRALAISDSIGAKNYVQDCYALLSELYEKSDVPLPDSIGGKLLSMAKMPSRSLYYFKRSIAIKEVLFSEENRKQLVRKEMNYEFEKKEAITKAKNEKQQAISEEKNRKQKIITWSVASSLFFVILFAGFIFRSLRITRKQKIIIESKNTETECQKKIIEERNKDITDSIRYAKRIQDALLREEEHVSMHLPEHFILFIPKDIVSGDFYWGFEKTLPSPNGEGLGLRYWYFAAVDCTGHGVPGAIMSMLGISFLNDIVSAEGLLSPAEILNQLRAKVVKELRQSGEAGGSKDGMDISLCRLGLPASASALVKLERRVNAEVKVSLQWAGANNSLNFIRNGKLEEIKPDKQPIGYHPESNPFSDHEIKLQKGDSIYIYTDGFADQFGGQRGKKFNYRQLEDLIVSNNHLSMKDQKAVLKTCFSEWKGSLEQVDDVCIFGVRI